jgi:AcrR family transcriptional regulator
MVDVKRLPYRQFQALETRRRITAAARRLFAENGYANTSIGVLASDVGVAERTVYAAFGTKIAILGSICEQWLEDSRTLTLIGEAAAEKVPRTALTLLARASRQQWESGADILRTLDAAAATDSAIAEMLREWAGNRESGMAHVIKPLSSRLRKGLTVRRASAIVRALTAPSLFQSLVGDSAWTPDEYERWLGESLVGQLLAAGDLPS